jgi:hypothetical protein
MAETKKFHELQPGGIGSACSWVRGAGLRPSALNVAKKASQAQFRDDAEGVLYCDTPLRHFYHAGVLGLNLMRLAKLSKRISGTLLKGGIFPALREASLKYLGDVGEGRIFFWQCCGVPAVL